MNFEIKLGTSGNSKMTMESLVHIMGKFWRKSRTSIFFTLLIAAAAAGAFIWQRSLSGSGWTDQRRQEFMDSQNQNVEFKEQAYKKVTDQIEQKERDGESEYQPIKDIFSSYK